MGCAGSALVPGLRQDEGPDIDRDTRDKLDGRFRQAFHTLRDKLRDAKAPTKSITTSDSYGPDDPFTLTWIWEVVKLPGHNLGDSIDEPLRSRLKKAAEKTVKRAFEKPEQPVLQVRNGQEAFVHAFPLLRCIELARRCATMSMALGLDPSGTTPGFLIA